MVLPGKEVISIRYNMLGNITSMVDPETGRWTAKEPR